MSEENAENLNVNSKKQSLRLLIIFSVCIVVIALVAYFYWYMWGRYEDSTRDAYVHGNAVKVTSQIDGIVTSVNTDNMFVVKQGDVIVELDRTDASLDFQKAQAMLASTVRNISDLFEDIYQQKANVAAKKALLEKAEIDYIDRQNLVGEGAVSQEDYVHAKLFFEESLAELKLAEVQLKKAYLLIQNTTIATHPDVLNAAQEVKQTYVRLSRCFIKAPANGVISQKGVQVGQHVNPTDELFAIVPLDQMWVQANFKEVDVSQIRIGQRARVRADMYGSEIIYDGYVSGIDGGTGEVFSLIPPQNATGNWIKIVQRLPIRIDIDSGQLERYPLRLGLSMHVQIDTKDQYGPRVASPREPKPLFVTDVYKNQEVGSDVIIRSLIEKNAGMSIDKMIVLSLPDEESLWKK